jgi:hypothetical protein
MLGNLAAIAASLASSAFAAGVLLDGPAADNAALFAAVPIAEVLLAARAFLGFSGLAHNVYCTSFVKPS